MIWTTLNWSGKNKNPKCERESTDSRWHGDERSQFATLLIYSALLPSAQMWRAQNALFAYQQKRHQINRPHWQISKEACRWAREPEITNYTPAQHGHKWSPPGPVRRNELKPSAVFASESRVRTGDQMIADESALQVSIQLLCVPGDKDQSEKALRGTVCSTSPCLQSWSLQATRIQLYYCI